MIIPNIWENKKWSKPPTRKWWPIHLFESCPSLQKMRWLIYSQVEHPAVPGNTGIKQKPHVDDDRIQFNTACKLGERERLTTKEFWTATWCTSVIILNIIPESWKTILKDRLPWKSCFFCVFFLIFTDPPKSWEVTTSQAESPRRAGHASLPSFSWGSDYSRRWGCWHRWRTWRWRTKDRATRTPTWKFPWADHVSNENKIPNSHSVESWSVEFGIPLLDYYI